MPKKKISKKAVKRTIKTTSGKQERIRYTDQQQKEAAEDVLIHGDKISQVARERKCSPISVSTWVKKYEAQIRKEAAGHQSGHPIADEPKHIEHRSEPEHHKPAVHKPAVHKPVKHDSDEKIEVSVGRVTLKFPSKISPSTVSEIIKQLDE